MTQRCSLMRFPAIAGPAWRTILIAAMGEELTPEERETFAMLTGGREREPDLRQRAHQQQLEEDIDGEPGQRSRVRSDRGRAEGRERTVGSRQAILHLRTGGQVGGP